MVRTYRQFRPAHSETLLGTIRPVSSGMNDCGSLALAPLVGGLKPPMLAALMPPSPNSAQGASLLTPGVSRRTVLKVAGAGGVVLLGGAWLYRTFWRRESPGPGLLCLTQDEFAFCEAVGEAFFPGPPRSPFSAKELDLGHFADRYVNDLYPDKHRLFKVLVRTMNAWPVLRHKATFVHLPLDVRRRVLESWERSPTLLQRASHQTLRILFSVGFFEDLRVRKALNLQFGRDLSKLFPEADWAREP